MATIIRRPGKRGISYRVQIKRKGAPALSETFHSLADAKRWIQITEGKILEGRHFPNTQAKKHTLGDVIDRYTQDVLPQKKPSTIRKHRQYLSYWQEHLGHCLLSNLTPAILVEQRDKLRRENRSNTTVNHYLAPLSHALNIAMREWNLIEDNPMRKVSKLKMPQDRVRYLSDEERTRLLEACKTSRNPWLYPITVIALVTGARKGELLSLRWSDVDLDRGRFTFQTTKNGTRRSVPLIGFAYHTLLKYAETVDTSPAAPVFPYDFRDAWERAVRRAGITNYRWHDNRHSCASYLAMNGASLAEIAEVLGHKTLQMTKRYAHLSEAHTAKVVAQMSQTIFGK